MIRIKVNNPYYIRESNSVLIDTEELGVPFGSVFSDEKMNKYRFDGVEMGVKHSRARVFKPLFAYDENHPPKELVLQ
jgi:hypothetical protein